MVRKLLLLGILVVAIGGLFVVKTELFSGPEAEQCKAFVLKNAEVQNFFGTIKSVTVRFVGSGRTEKQNAIWGYYSFVVKGSKQTGEIRVEWNMHGINADVTRISVRTGLMGENQLWPPSKTEVSKCLLPSHIWDGIILLGMSFINFLFHISIRKNGSLVRFFYPPALRLTKLTWTFLISAIALFLYSIICFLNIWILL